MHKLGILVNPIAGMGGRVGLRGTDGERTLEEAIRKGAEPVSPGRLSRFLEELRLHDAQFELMPAPGTMGAEIASQLGLEHKSIGTTEKTTTSEDTVRISRLMKGKVDLIVFCGGDGTARDVLEGVGKDMPVLGVPAGVKLYSSVFAITPVSAADSALAFLHGDGSTRLGEVVDVDESAFRKNRLSVKLFGYLTIPDSVQMVRTSKSGTSLSEDVNLDAIADHVMETISPTTTYVLGPGSTVERIAKRLGVTKTLLGVDAVRGDGTLLGSDLDESALIKTVDKGPPKIIVSPIGGQGFLFGRGNQQISPRILRMVGVENIMVVSSRNKIESLRPRRLLVDSGDDEIDERLRGYVSVITGYREEMVVKIE